MSKNTGYKRNLQYFENRVSALTNALAEIDVCTTLQKESKGVRVTLVSALMENKICEAYAQAVEWLRATETPRTIMMILNDAIAEAQKFALEELEYKDPLARLDIAKEIGNMRREIEGLTGIAKAGVSADEATAQLRQGLSQDSNMVTDITPEIDPGQEAR